MDNEKSESTQKPVEEHSSPVNEFSRTTSARIELLRRFINRSARDAKAETWDKIYMSLKPFLTGADAETANEPPPRLGPAYRRHHELVAMTSDQKILLDEFAMLSDRLRKQVLQRLAEASNNAAATKHVSLTAEENRLMGYFTALSPEEAEKQLLEITAIATEELQRLRKELL